MVLSGVGASDEAWKAFDDAWNVALSEVGIETWHSTDNFRRRSRASKPEAPIPLVNVIGKQVTQEFNAVSFAVDKAAAAAARIIAPGTVPPVEQMLMDLCFRRVGVAKEDSDQAGRLQVLFDQNEPFIRQLKPYWQTRRTELRRAKKHGWPTQIYKMEPARSEDHPGLQAADLLSWVIRCRYEYGDKLIDPKVIMIMFAFMGAGKLRGGFLNESAIQSLYMDKRVPDLRHSYSFV